MFQILVGAEGGSLVGCNGVGTVGRSSAPYSKLYYPIDYDEKNEFESRFGNACSCTSRSVSRLIVAPTSLLMLKSGFEDREEGSRSSACSFIHILMRGSIIP